MHFRRIPLGFEPLSVETNSESSMKWRLTVLNGFWKAAVTHATQAADIASCRNQTLLIYFATDDASHLRADAMKHLSPIGRVVFGLDEKEVGHVSPQWSQQSIDAMQQKAIALYKEGKVAVGGKAELPSSETRMISDMTINGDAILPNDDDDDDDDDDAPPNLAELMVDVATNPEATSKHALMALVEW